MLKQYYANVHIDGHYTTEDPKCPFFWRGSGCYDIEVPTWDDLEVEVWAATEEDAKKLIYEYSFYSPERSIDIDAVQIEKIEFVKDLEDHDDEEAGVIDDFTINWKQYEKD